MALNEIQTNVNHASAYSMMQSVIKMNETPTSNKTVEQVAQNNTDTFTLSNDVDEILGIYSPKTISTKSTTATSSNISGSTSIISNKKRAFAKQAGVSLNSSLQPIINGADDAKRAQNYYSLLCKPVNKSVSSSYVLNQNDSSKTYYGNCCKTSCEMMAKINSNGTATANGTTDKIGNYSLVSGDKTYSPTQRGFYDYSGLTKEELSNIIVSEIDNGRVVQLHTSYQNSSGKIGEHWVVVTGYTLDSTGKISTTVQNGKDYITGLAGIDPWNDVGGRTQVTNDLGKNTTVSSSGQWLNTSTGGYQVRTYRP
ncbi:MAG: hypothetical protein ACI4JK_03675 [Oscillospiraceae bacterium]